MEHFSKLTVEAECFCRKCNRSTTHRIHSGRPGACLRCLERPTVPKPVQQTRAERKAALAAAQMWLFPVPDAQDGAAACIWPGCGKIRDERGGVYCPHHDRTAEWEAAEPERRKRQAEFIRNVRRIKEELLAASPLRAVEGKPAAAVQEPCEDAAPVLKVG